MHRQAFLAAAALTGVLAQWPADQHLPSDLDPLTLPNNSLYFRWRTHYHVIAPNGHLNDPCAPMYDPTRDTYHIFYQSFPQHINGGNKTWGHATSKDLITWQDIGGWENRTFVAIEPSPYSVPSYDWLGIFSGGGYPVNLRGEEDGNLTVFYTGNVIVPDNWKVPYELGPPHATEQQAIATSSDGGETWQKWEGNPFINGQPGGWNVTGFRDPQVAPNPALDKVLGKAEPHYYQVYGSGIRGVGPRIPLYSAKAKDLTNWTFEGGFWEPPINYTWGGDRSKTGNYGANFEVATFWDEVEKEKYGGDGLTRHWLFCLGSEGYPDERHPFDKWSLYVLGDMKRRANGSAEFEISASGVLDWGNAYALNTFYDPKTQRRIMWGWSQEDFSNRAGWAQGFVSSLMLPQEIYVLKFKDVLAPTGGVSEGPHQWTLNPDGKTYTVTTVGQHPLPDVVAGIQGRPDKLLDAPINVTDIYNFPSVNSSRLHLQAHISQVPEASPENYVGIQVRASPGKEEYTELRYYPATNSVLLDRSKSSLLGFTGKADFFGHFEPFRFANGTTEEITIDVFVDGSLLEFFINNRFALTHRVYPSRTDALGAALVARGSATFDSATAWEMETNAWPNRPLNASSPLIYDKYYENHVTFDNPYVQTNYRIYDGN